MLGVMCRPLPSNSDSCEEISISNKTGRHKAPDTLGGVRQENRNSNQNKTVSCYFDAPTF